jgi:hypothetical protein
MDSPCNRRSHPASCDRCSVILGSMFPRGYAQRLINQTIDLAPRAEVPYATHVPILVGVATAFKPKVLIEFGSGTFSTLSFLDDVAFPSLQKVESYENNRQWFEQVREQLPPNTLIDLHFVEGDMHQAVDGANTREAGVIFIDDSPTEKARVPTVEEVARRCGDEPVVILHDYDLWRLRLTARKFENRICFRAFNPQSCTMWHGHPERRPILETVNRVIRQHATDVALTDIRAWKELFSMEFR